MPTTIEFKHSLKARVKIKEIDRPGTVDALTCDFLGVQYSVSYWENCERKRVWVFEEEIEAHEGTD